MTGDPVIDAPTVSVVLPTYNRASVLGRAVESVFDQSYEPLELIVVDGGSTDGTAAVLDRYDGESLRLIRRSSPTGPSAARNAGIRAAGGELVAFVDDDDRWHPGKLRRQVAALRRANGAVSLTRVEKSTGEPRTRSGVPGDAHGAIRRLELPTYTSTLLAERAALIDVGGFDESLGCFEDWELCLRLARSYAFAFVDEPLVEKGTNGENISADPERLARAVARIDDRYALPRVARARFLADAGVTYCEAGRLDDGLPYLLRSLTLNPTRGRVALALALASVGDAAGRPELFDAGMNWFYRAERAVASRRGDA